MSTPLKTPRENLNTRLSIWHLISLPKQASSILVSSVDHVVDESLYICRMIEEKTPWTLSYASTSHIWFVQMHLPSSPTVITCQLLCPHGKIEQNDLIKATNAVTAILRMTNRARKWKLFTLKTTSVLEHTFFFRNPFGSSGKTNSKKRNGHALVRINLEIHTSTAQ